MPDELKTIEKLRSAIIQFQDKEFNLAKRLVILALAEIEIEAERHLVRQTRVCSQDTIDYDRDLRKRANKDIKSLDDNELLLYLSRIQTT